MTTNFLRSALAAGLALYLAAEPGIAVAAMPAIGTMVTSGAFRLNHATVRSNATLFEGAMVETGPMPARMYLASGTRLELESGSVGRVFAGRLVLDRGAARIDTAGTAAAGPGGGIATGYLVEAGGLTIQPDASTSTGRIVLSGAGRVEVAALTGSFRVLNSGSTLVAKIASGRALALEAQSAPGLARITGLLMKRDGHYLLTDETMSVTVELSGTTITRPNLTNALGQRVVITGSARRDATPVSGATQMIEVAQVTPAPPGSGSDPGSVRAPSGSGGTGGTAPAGAGGAGAGGGAAGGASGRAAVSVTLIAIIGGVAAAAVVGGLAATGSLGGSTTAPVSR